MDPISFFVTPVTIVICKHVPTANDPTHHLLDVHKICRKKKHRQWQKMTTSGVVDHDVLELLLQEHADNFVNLVRLMIKFGLLVHLQSGGSAKDEYLVPALLPPSSSDGTWSDSQWSTCFLVFTTSEEFQQFTTISEKDLNMYGFLPSGLFERLIGKAVIWAQNTSANQSYTNFLLNHDEAILFFGSQRFRLKVRDDICSIEVNIEGLNPKAVHQRLMEQVQTIIEECMKSLFCFTALQYPFNMSNSSTAPFQLSEDCFLIPLGQIRSIVDSHSVLNRPGGRRLLTEAEAKTMYRDWLPNYEQRSRYDVFLSYRWGASDSLFVQCAFDRCGLFTVGPENREIGVFLDKECLQEGRLFQNEFAQAMKNTLVVVPVVSSDALLRMCTGQADVEDNVIVEVT